MKPNSICTCPRPRRTGLSAKPGRSAASATEDSCAAAGETDVESLRASLPPLVGQLPEIIGFGPLLIFPAAVAFMTFLSFFIGTFLQLMWEDIPITEPL